jgi:hypothetical protein
MHRVIDAWIDIDAQPEEVGKYSWISNHGNHGTLLFQWSKEICR